MNLICIPALKCHKDNLAINIENLLNFINKNEILIVTPDVDDYKDFQFVFFRSLENIHFYV